MSGATLNVGTLGGSDTAGTLGSGDLTISGGATLNFNRSNAYNFTGSVIGSGTGAGSVNQLGARHDNHRRRRYEYQYGQRSGRRFDRHRRIEPIGRRQCGWQRCYGRRFLNCRRQPERAVH